MGVWMHASRVHFVGAGVDLEPSEEDPTIHEGQSDRAQGKDGHSLDMVT